jgi:undecaprenyl-diphosphatase
MPPSVWLRLRRSLDYPDRRPSFSVLLAVLLAAGGLYGFILVLDEVMEGKAHAVDTRILLAFRQAGRPDDPVGPAWLEIMFRDITALGSFSVLTLITIAVLGYLALMRRAGTAVFVLAAVAGGALISSLLKAGIGRPRPDLVSQLVDVSTLSFPSGHAMASAATYLTLGTLLARVLPSRRLRVYVLTIAVAVTLLVGVSRIYLGVHWPSDVLAGWCAGAAWAMLCWLIARWFGMGGGSGRQHRNPQVSPGTSVRKPESAAGRHDAQIR